MVDINRGTSGVSLPPELSQEIWGNTVEASVVMQAARQIELPGSGTTIHTVTGEPVAEWVAETAEKPVKRHTLSNKALTPYKIAVIEPFSNEFRRDMPRLYSELARRLPFSIAKTFDQTVYGKTGAPVYKTRAEMVSGTIGFAGDWQADAVWGSVEGVKVAISDQASITDGTITVTDDNEDDVVIPNVINLWQRNMFAIRAEIEIGFRVTDVDRFVKLTSS